MNPKESGNHIENHRIDIPGQYSQISHAECSRSYRLCLEVDLFYSLPALYVYVYSEFAFVYGL